MIKTIPTKEPGTIFRSDRKRWTYDDLWKVFGETLEHIEIIDGVLYMAPSPHVNRHQRTLFQIARLLDDYVTARDLGRVYLSPADVVASPERVVQPDVFFVAKERLDIVDAYVDGAPNLVVEVLSPSSVEYDRETKFDLYEDIGVKEYWIVDPMEHTVDVFTRRGGALEQAGSFAAGETMRSVLLGDFTAALDAVFV